jgi:hypothetical protein
MKRFYRLVARVLIVSIAWTPFSLQAAMIGTDQVVTGAVDQATRDKVLNFVQRADVVKQLETLGLSPATAKERVNAMTQDELNRVAGQIDSLPAGADSTGWIIAAVVIGIIIWYMYYRK